MPTSAPLAGDGKPARPRRLDTVVLRAAFVGLLAATVVVLGLDYAELRRQDEAESQVLLRRGDVPANPLPPSRDREAPALPGAPADPALSGPMGFDLQADGRLVATGRIDPGTAAIFAAEIDKRGSYVKTVVLASPGGSVTDALSMGRLIRDKGFATEIAAGTYCASSCPLILAGGVERRVGAGAAVGVHQVFAWADDPGAAGASMADGMDQAQRVSAECQRYLVEMGIDPRVWMHAMETPKEELFYFTPDELVGLKLATGVDGPGVRSAAAR